MTKRMGVVVLLVGLALCVVGIYVAGTHGKLGGGPSQDWPAYGGQPAQDHYSPLTQINRQNVSKLVVAWQFDTGEKGGLESSPIVVGRVLYSNTPKPGVVALDAATGKLLWKFQAPGGGGE